MPYIPGTDQLFMYDFVYVDRARTRSLLAQLDDGVLAESTTGTDKARARGGGLTTPFVKADGMNTNTDRETEVRHQQETEFLRMEKLAEHTKFLIDISDEELDDYDLWESGEIQEIAPPGKLIRVTTRCRLIDAGYAASVMEQFVTMTTFLQPLAQGKVNKKDVTMMDNLTKAALASAADGVTLRVEPDPLAPTHGFVGKLLERSEYIEPEREALHLKYGREAREMTVVARVTRYPEERHPDKGFTVNSMFRGGSLTPSLNLLPGLFDHALEHLEVQGFRETARWPGGAIIPIAVYETFTPHGTEDDDE